MTTNIDEHRHADGEPPIQQDWHLYTEEEHDRWRRLYARMLRILPGRACKEFLDGLRTLDISPGIPKFEDINTILKNATGWEVVGVRGLVTDKDFFTYLSRRQFPVTCFLRREDQFDYIVEPDIFHDAFGHLPMLMTPVIADYLQAYGLGGLKVLNDATRLAQLARLYWYTIEFGLVMTSEGLRIYGSGIVSSPKESISSLLSRRPLRVMFDLVRVMSTLYEIDHEQDIYFVITGLGDLIAVTMQDFVQERVYERVARRKEIRPGVKRRGDKRARPNQPLAV